MEVFFAGVIGGVGYSILLILIAVILWTIFSED
jgi:hypothetical protein